VTDTLVLPAAADAVGGVATDTAEITFIGTATVLFRWAGFTVLTDPNFLHAGDHVYLGKGLFSTRRTDPAMGIDDLPPLDFVVLSHHHGDHFDRVAASRLDKDLPIVTEPHSARMLTKQGFRRPIALRTWESQRVRKGDAEIRVTSMPGKHAPDPIQRLIPPTMGSMLELSEQGRTRAHLYITGDTLVHDRLREIPARYPDIDACLIHLGGTRVAGIYLTMDGEQGVRCLQMVRPRRAVPIHYDDYTVFKSPLSDFQAEVERAGAGLATEVHYVDRGETWTFPVPR
jgi:L-ascorbate metabolism protein UlaG (beta-lactamase superfamily)